MAYDWAIVRREYVQGCPDTEGEIRKPTLQFLADKHGLSMSTLKKRAAKEKWVQERNIFSAKKEQEVMQHRMYIMAGEAAAFDSKSLDAANAGIEDGLRRLKQSDLSNNDFHKLSSALVNFQKIGKLALGEPTEHVQSDNKHDVSIDDKDPDRRADITDLFQRWDEKAD